MDTHIVDHLKTLHTSEIDARNGYEEALEDAEGKGLTPLFRDMIGLHHANAEELGGMLINAGEDANDTGSILSIVHRTIMSVRSLFDGLDGSVLPGLIDGEKRNVTKYEEALRVLAGSPAIGNVLEAQRDKIQAKIALMEQQAAAYEAAES